MIPFNGYLSGTLGIQWLMLFRSRAAPTVVLNPNFDVYIKGWFGDRVVETQPNQATPCRRLGEATLTKFPARCMEAASWAIDFGGHNT